MVSARNRARGSRYALVALSKKAAAGPLPRCGASTVFPRGAAVRHLLVRLAPPRPAPFVRITTDMSAGKGVH